MAGERRVLLVGLGTIARTHLEVLAAIPEVTVVGGVDPAVTGLDLPVFVDLFRLPGGQMRKRRC